MSLTDHIRALIHERGPLTVAAFMDLALYHPEFGYYSRPIPKSGSVAPRAATSPEVGPLFGDVLADQIAEMATILRPEGAPFTLVDAGAGDGRLSHDMLRGLRRAAPRLCDHTHLHVVERSDAARAAQPAVLAAWTEHALGADRLPDEFEGVIVGNELLDSMPVHHVVMREHGLREVMVCAIGDGFATLEAPPSSPQLEAHLEAAGITLATGAAAIVPLAAINWMQDALTRLRRGFIILIERADDGVDGREPGCTTRAALAGGTGRHWLDRPGEEELIAPLDVDAVRRAAEALGCTALASLTQTAFLVEVAGPRVESFDAGERHEFNVLVKPSGLGALRVLVLGRGVGRPSLRCAHGA